MYLLNFSSLAIVSICASLGLAATELGSSRTCTVKAEGQGRDDAPKLISAILDPSCSTVEIPKGTTLNISTKMDTSGAKNKHISLEGTIKFNDNLDYWLSNAFPIAFQNQSTFWLLGGENIALDGGGTLDGSGELWWETFAKNSSLVRPIILTVINASHVSVENIHMINSPEWFNLVHSSSDITYSGLNITASSTKGTKIANTDGWDIYRSDSVIVRDSIINNQDDCVSFKPNTTNVLVSNLTCTGSHGISVGSLGQYSGIFDIVENVTSTNVRLIDTQNGARIKAFAGPGVGSGIVKNVTFENFTETSVDNPLVIDQCYETSASACESNPSNVLIQDIVFSDISGTGSGSTVATLDCSPGGRCSNITVNGITLSGPSGKGTYECENVELSGNSAAAFGTCSTT